MLNLPSFKDIINRVRSDISNLLPNVDPTIFGSFVRAFSDSTAGRHFDNVLLLEQLEQQLFPQTAAGIDLERWAGYEGLSRFVATEASGNLTATGTTSSVIPNGTEFRAESGSLYTSTSAGTISATSISTTLARSGTTVTATTASDHSFASNTDVTISGANEAEYNGSYTITVTDTDKFQYEITGTPTTPATGTILATCNCATIPVTSNDNGTAQNLSSGAILTLTTPITGVDVTGYVQFLGIIGGQDIETDDALRIRVLQSRESPVTNFNSGAIEKIALSIQGVTRVKIKRITPIIGAVTVLFVRDNDTNIIPDSSEVADVRNKILEDLPATSDETDVIVTAPTPVSTDFTFSAISPNTVTMKTAIENNLIAFYEDEVDFETDIVEDKYRAAIIGTIDPDTGDTLASFTLTNPTADITVGTDSIGTLGDITFA